MYRSANLAEPCLLMFTNIVTLWEAEEHKWVVTGTRGIRTTGQTKGVRKITSLHWYKRLMLVYKNEFLCTSIEWMHCVCFITKSYPTFCDPVECSPPGSSVRGISQVRIMEGVAISFSRESSRDWTSISCIGRQVLYYWAMEWVPSYRLIKWTCHFLYQSFKRKILLYVSITQLESCHNTAGLNVLFINTQVPNNIHLLLSQWDFS